ncbi:MAG: SDR family oxidoreductase [Bacteroidales bacterium]|nr:SDR family oxidoreductase [Bacteroidales bacterium]
MKILLTGATGYIGKRLLPVLLGSGHEVVCCVRDTNRFNAGRFRSEKLGVIEVDFLIEEELSRIPGDIEAAFYLIHSMATISGSFEEMEATSAENFKKRLEQTQVRQVIYLSGIVNEKELSKHLSSRKNVEDILTSRKYALTTLRAGIIVGSGSASFEIIRDLVEKLPVMVAPRWLGTKCQPIAIRNVVEFLSGVLLKQVTYNRSFDIGGPEILSYKDMLLRFARIRGLSRYVVIVPVMTPRLSSYWLYFVTSVSYSLATHLVNSMKVEVVCKDNELEKILGISTIGYDKAIELAFDRIEQHQVLSSWKDALTNRNLRTGLSHFIEVPVYGCYKDTRKRKVNDAGMSVEKIWAIGGENGWYYADLLWNIRGFMDRLIGGVGIRRGRTSPGEISAGDALDFWRVIYADKKERRMLLYAEMKLPGEAWLEFKIEPDNVLQQTATFRPKGIWGRIYWFAMRPFHGLIFNGMIRNIAAEI